MNERTWQLAIGLCVLGSAGVISWVLSHLSRYSMFQIFVPVITVSAGLVTLSRIIYNMNHGDEQDGVTEVLDELDQGRSVSKEDLRELGQVATLSVYASKEAAESYYQLSNEELEDLDRRLRSVRRGGVDDIGSFPNRGSRSPSLRDEYFRLATPKFDVGFTLVRERPNGAHLLNVSNNDSDTEVGLYISRIVERPDSN